MRIEKINRLSWLSTEGIPSIEVQQLKDRLTIFSENVVDESLTEIRLWDEEEGLLGVPRQFGLKHHDPSSAIDCTRISFVEDFPDFQGTLRDYQEEKRLPFISALLKNGYGGIIHAKCGGGKTVFILDILAHLKMRTLIILHKTDLMNQWKGVTDAEAEDGRGFGIKKFLGLKNSQIGWVKQDIQHWRNYPITIASYQTIRSREKTLRKQGFFDYFSIVVVDEIHRSSALTYQQVIKLLNPKFHLGATATPRRADGLQDIFFWNTGPILAKLDVDAPTGTFIQMPWMNPYARKLRSLSTGITRICADTKRNYHLMSEMLKAYRAGRSVLAMSDRLAQIDFLIENIKSRLREDESPRIIKFTAGISTANQVAAKKADFVIGTYKMFGEGTDIPYADTLFLLSPRGDIEQFIGRIQRVEEGKKSLIVYDMADTGMGILVGLNKKRKKELERMGFKTGGK